MTAKTPNNVKILQPDQKMGIKIIHQNTFECLLNKASSTIGVIFRFDSPQLHPSPFSGTKTANEQHPFAYRWLFCLYTHHLCLWGLQTALMRASQQNQKDSCSISIQFLKPFLICKTCYSLKFNKYRLQFFHIYFCEPFADKGLKAFFRILGFTEFFLCPKKNGAEPSSNHVL